MDKITFIKGDICNRGDVEKVGDCDVIFNFAAETHVDRSIINRCGCFCKNRHHGNL